MRIVLFGPLPSIKNTGGPETITYNLATNLSKKGHIVTVFKGFFGSKPNIKNIHFYNIPRLSIIRDSDIIHIILALKSGGIVGGYIAHIFNKPLVVHFHHPKNSTHLTLKHKFINTIEASFYKYLLCTSDKVISVSNYSKNALTYMWGIDSIVIPPGVDTSYFSSLKNSKSFLIKYKLENSDKRILFVGNLIKRKGVYYLIKAFSEIQKTLKNISLIIIGDGPEKNKLVKLVKNLGLNKVYILGRVSHKDLLSAYLSSDIFVLPTLEEGFGIVLIEAMACGLPVIVTHTSGTLDVIVDRRFGIFVPPRNIETLADAITSLISDYDERIKLGNSAREYVLKNFDWKIITQEIENIYKFLI